MSRPRLQEHQLRKPYAMVRLTDFEEAAAEARRERLGGDRSTAQFVRACVLQTKIQALPTPSAEALALLSAIGNNLNQVTRAVNSGAVPAHLGEVLQSVFEGLERNRTLLLRGEDAGSSLEDSPEEGELL